MRPAHVIEITTPKKFVLDGLWFGPKNAKRAIIMVHGLTSSAFSMQHVVGALTDNRTAVISFNNRGFKSVVDIKQRISKEETKWRTAGSAHEVFTECVDDIQGAINLVRKTGVKDIYLAGHSTGCQKSIYWAFKTGGKGVRGIILLAPLSDYASEKAADKGGRMKKATALARKLVMAKKPHELLPRWASPIMLLDAQRYLSLYTPDSAEEIFTYGQPGRRSRTYESVTLPILALFADKDEYSDRPAERLAAWFATNTRSQYFRAGIVPKVGHGFKHGERKLARLVKKWMQ
jgi:pimeloyl-ACP methyl ester carboxylesterase